MAVLIEGLQGSGKSYWASYRMYYDGDKYYKIYTNLDGIVETDKIELLEFKSFMNGTLKELYEQQVEMDLSFDECITILKEKEILPENASKDNRVLFVIDEAQNYFGKSVKLQPQLVWFITQHRHLFIELYLITQKYTLLRDDYKLFNLSYKAYPPVRQFSKNKIKYEEFAGLSYPPTNKVRSFTLPKEQKIFDMYVSGDKVESPNILKRFGVMFVFLLVFLVAIVYYFISNFIHDDTVEEQVTDILDAPKIVQKKVVKNKNIDTSLKLYTFVVWEDGYFYIRGLDETVSYPITFLKYIKDTYFVTVVEKEELMFRTMIYVLCDERLGEFLKPEEKEKERQGLGNLDSFTSSIGSEET